MNKSTTASAPSDFLLRMAASSRRRLAIARADCDETEMQRRAESQLPSTVLRLSEQGFDLIAEVKRRSPSVGSLASVERPPAAQAQNYADAGAAAISVLTEPEQFSGELAHLIQVFKEVTTVPAMRKDFLVSPYQVFEARAAGAGGVLLIAAILDRVELRDMLQTALDLGMFVLVEAFDVDDLDLCLPVIAASGPAMLKPEESVDGRAASQCRIMIGVNCRDLRTLQVDFPRFERLAGCLPDIVPWVAESGVGTPEQAAGVAGLGYRLALVGTALMQANDPTALARAILTAGRSAAGNA
jgi:indole-3-glycerol phosphate synthase